MRLAQARTCSGFMQLDHAVPSCGTVQNRQLWHRRGTVQLQHGPRGSQPSSQARRQWPRRYGCVLIARASAGADPVMHVRHACAAALRSWRNHCTSRMHARQRTRCGRVCGNATCPPLRAMHTSSSTAVSAHGLVHAWLDDSYPPLPRQLPVGGRHMRTRALGAASASTAGVPQ